MNATVFNNMLGFSKLIGQWFRSLLSVLVFLAAPMSAVGQDGTFSQKSLEFKSTDANNSKKDGGLGAGKSPTETLLPRPTIRYLPTKDNNELIPIPDGLSLEEYTKWFEEDRNKPRGPQAYTITEVDIEGNTNDERATLVATFTIHIPQSERFERVPLFFNDAVLMPGATYVGDGEQIMETKKDPKQGYICWFKGKGRHRLRLTFSVPLQKPIPSRHLIVPVPISAVSHIKMTLPYSSVKTTVLPEKAVVVSTPAGVGKTVVEIFGLGSHLDFSWQPNLDVRTNDLSLDSQTTILAQIESEQALLKVNQKISSLYGQFDTITVTLPTNASAVTLEGPEKPSLKYDPENRHRAVITFKDKIASASLNWTVRIPAKLKSPLLIDGFVIEESREVTVKHVGMIGLLLAKGLLFSERHNSIFPTGQMSLPRVPVSEFPATIGTVDRAYKFINQPFKLVTAFDEVRPTFEVKTQLALTASANQLMLDAKFDYRVDRYSMNEVVLSWPAYNSEDWTIDSIDNPEVVESYSPDEHGQITVRLIEQFSGKFTIHLRAHRLFTSNQEVVFSLPRPKSATRMPPSCLILINAENVETDLTPRGETVFRPLPSSFLESVGLDDSVKELKAAPFRLDTDEQSFGLRVVPHKQKLRTESFVEAKWQDGQFQLVQHMYYDVEYERLNQVRILVPPTINFERCRFSRIVGNKKIELKPESVQSFGVTRQQLQLKLGEAELGKFEIVAEFSIPFPKDPTFDKSTLVELPFFESSDEPYSQTRFSLVQSEWFDANPAAEDSWRPQRNRQDASEWMADGEQKGISLCLVRSARKIETGTVSLALINLALDETGEGRVLAQFRVSTRTSFLPIQLPPNARLATFFWDEKQLEFLESPTGSNRFVFEPEANESKPQTEHLLTVKYRERFAPAMDWTNNLTLGAPLLSNCSWNRVIWQVVLPSGHHLLTYPHSAARLFHWQRSALIWNRVPDFDADFLQKKMIEGISGNPVFNDELTETIGNSYLFQQLDSPKPLVFHTLISSMVVLFGTGVSLLVGFVVYRVVALRHILTLLVVALIVAFVRLWYSAPFELLLQPMIAGLCFPLAAILLEVWIRRRYEVGVVSFGRHGEFPPLQAFGGSNHIVRQADPNEDTLHRHPDQGSERGVQIESGSGVS